MQIYLCSKKVMDNISCNFHNWIWVIPNYTFIAARNLLLHIFKPCVRHMLYARSSGPGVNLFPRSICSFSKWQQAAISFVVPLVNNLLHNCLTRPNIYEISVQIYHNQHKVEKWPVTLVSESRSPKYKPMLALIKPVIKNVCCDPETKSLLTFNCDLGKYDKDTRMQL